MLDEFKHAFQRPNNGHIQLIIINVVIYLVMAFFWVVTYYTPFPEISEIIFRQIALPASLPELMVKPWTVITYAFAHSMSDIWHIVGNMIGLYWFGKLIVEYLGNDKLIAIYVLGALAGAASYILLYNTSSIFSGAVDRSTLIGASAAVYAIIVAAATLLPDYSFYLLLIGPVKIKWIALAYIVISFIGLRSANAGGNIAHLGGVVIGFVYIKQLQAGNNWGSWITSVLYFVKNLFKPRSKVKVTYRKPSPGKPASNSGFTKATQSEIDTILDKISDHGYESLTKDEKEKLFNEGRK